MPVPEKREPCECKNISEIRNELDRIDRQILDLFACRQDYIEAITRFKNNEEEAIALDRKEFVLKQRADWAASRGLDPEVFKNIYRILIENNIQKELDIISKRSDKNQ